VYLVIDGVKYWIMLGPSGPTLYRREGSKTKYLGRRPIAEIKEMLARASAEAVQKIKADLETVKQAVESQKPAQTTQTLTWKKDGHAYWLLQYGRTFYVYMKGPTTRHRPRLVEKTDVNGVVGRVLAAGAFHVLEALRFLINGIYAAVVDLLRPRSAAEVRREASRKAEEAQVPRREAEEAFRRLRGELHRAVERWDEMWRREAEKRGYWGGPDRKWLKERLSDFVNACSYLLEKIALYEDLMDKFVDAVEEAALGYLTRRDILEVLESKL
jgi:AcrR family transcriptional regulator